MKILRRKNFRNGQVEELFASQSKQEKPQVRDSARYLKNYRSRDPNDVMNMIGVQHCFAAGEAECGAYVLWKLEREKEKRIG